MNTLACLTAMALLGIGLTVAQQNAKPSSDPSNSSNPSAQSQSAGEVPQTPSGRRTQSGNKDEAQQPTAPDTTIRDQQSSTISTTGVNGQDNNQPSTSTMGTTGSTPPNTEEQPRLNPGVAPSQDQTSPEQQPNPSSPPAPQARLLQTPAARAVATHSPDPGTCMNPAALETGQNPNQGGTARTLNCD